MGARKTGLDIAVFSLDGSDLLAQLTSISVAIDGTILNGAGIAEQFARHLWAGGKGTVTAKINHLTSAVPSTNLNVTAWSLGGSSLIGSLRSGSLKFTNPSQAGKGISDLWEYPQAVAGRVMEGSGSLQVDASTLIHAIMQKAASATPSDHTLAFTMTIGADTFAGDVVLSNATHAAERGGIQEVNVSFQSKTTPTSAGSGIYTTVITGDALFSIILDTKAGQYGTSGAALVALCTSLDISFADGQIVEATFTMEVQGQPTDTTSS